MADKSSPSESPALWFALGAAVAITPTLLHAAAAYLLGPSKCPVVQSTAPSLTQTEPFDHSILPPTAAASGCPYLASQGEHAPPIDLSKFIHRPSNKQSSSPSSSTTFQRTSSSSSSSSSSTTGGTLNKPQKGKDPVHYHKYLDLDNILSAQRPISWQEGGTNAHDEHLFIITHQASELWFKQLLHDLLSVVDIMRASYISENSMAVVLERLNRICKIQTLLIGHLNVLETMTPLSFLDFRDYLYPASGFQSHQFRQVECLLGLTREQRLTYAGSDYDTVLLPEQQQSMRELETTIPTLFSLIDTWLARTPLLDIDGFNFWHSYRDAVAQMLNEQEETVTQQYKTEGSISRYRYDAELTNIASQRSFFTTFFDESKYNDAVHAAFGKNASVLSYKAVQAATMINVYQHLTLFSPAFQLLTLLQEIDSNFARWRSAHASMVLRMIGGKMGTGGSSGFGYLSETINKHRIFKQLSDLSSLVIPRPYLPILPEHVIRSTSFFPEDFQPGGRSRSQQQSEVVEIDIDTISEPTVHVVIADDIHTSSNSQIVPMIPASPTDSVEENGEGSNNNVSLDTVSTVDTVVVSPAVIDQE